MHTRICAPLCGRSGWTQTYWKPMWSKCMMCDDIEFVLVLILLMLLPFVVVWCSALHVQTESDKKTRVATHTHGSTHSPLAVWFYYYFHLNTRNIFSLWDIVFTKSHWRPSRLNALPVYRHRRCCCRRPNGSIIIMKSSNLIRFGVWRTIHLALLHPNGSKTAKCNIIILMLLRLRRVHKSYTMSNK